MRINLPGLTLMQGDCLERMKEIPDGSVNLVLVDPPYEQTRNKWDVMVPIEEMWVMVHKKCEGAFIFTASQPFASILVSSNIKNFKHEWVWCKNRATGAFNANRQPLKSHESILVFGAHKYSPQKTTCHKPVNNFYTRKSGSCYGKGSKSAGGGSTERYPTSILQFNCERGLHPTQKPVALMEYLIKTYTNEGDTVLDFTMGSGTTGVACVNTGRNFIGIELGHDHFGTAVNRIAEAHACSTSPNS